MEVLDSILKTKQDNSSGDSHVGKVITIRLEFKFQMKFGPDQVLPENICNYLVKAFLTGNSISVVHGWDPIILFHFLI